MKITLYLSHEKDGTLKDRERIFGEALRSGFEKHGDTVAVQATHEFVSPDWSSQLAVVIGIKGHSKRIFEDYRRGGRQVMLVDKSYFGRTEYVRLSIGGFQPPYAHATPRPHDRWNRIRSAFGIEVKPRQTGGYVIYAGSSQKYCDWHGLGDVSDYAANICGWTSKATRGVGKTFEPMRVLYRPKPSWAAGHPEEVKLVAGTEFSGPDVKLGRILGDCYALVTHGSNAAVEAVIAGVPAVVVSKGACAAEPVAELKLAHIREAFFPDDAVRLQWLANLAYCQFNMRELVSGLAWEILSPFTMKAGMQAIAQMAPDDSVIAQYQMMHAGEKMYRGNSTRGHIEAIKQLVDKHAPQSLLDYGSGKGRQYDELNIHEQWGGLKPVCYDPGYPPLATKPQGKFDGVISTDVAEHIPESQIDAFLADVIGYATKFAFFCIFTQPSRKFLPDGRNCHLTQRPRGWWIDRLEIASKGKVTGAYMADDTKHYLIESADGPAVNVTFRGSD